MSGKNGVDGGSEEKEHWFWKAGDLIAKALIPLVIGIFAFSQGKVAEKNRAAENRETVDRQKATDATQTDLKMLELVVPFVADKDTDRKRFGLSLITALRPELATRMYNVVQADPQVPLQIRTEAQSRLRTYRATILNGYTIDIFVLDTDQPNQRLAVEVKQFIDKNVSGNVRIKAKQQSFFDDVAVPVQNEVRFSGARQSAAEALVALINNWNPDLHFTTRETGTVYTNYLTVFLWK